MDPHNFQLIKQKTDRHYVFLDITKQKKVFLKLLRNNSRERSKELLSELFSEKIFAELGISDLQPKLDSLDGKPAILMKYYSDLAGPVPVNLKTAKIANRKYFAAALFIGDRFIKNANRQGKPEHIGWEDNGMGEIRLCPLDNGHTLGFESSVTDDSDLNGLSYSSHPSLEILEQLPATVIEEVLQKITELSFDVMGKELEELLIVGLLPIEEEKNFIKQRVAEIVSMLERRRPILEEALKKLSVPITVSA